MRIHGLFAAVALVIAWGITGIQAQEGPGNLGIPVDVREKVRDSFIFVLNDNVPGAEVRGRANAMARANGGRVTHVYTTALRGFAAKMPAAAAARMAAQNPNIAYFEPDGVAFAFKKPPWAGGGGGGEDPVCEAETIPPGITRVGGPVPGATATAWVIDTGIDRDHPDLNVDAGRSVNYANGKSFNDGNGHGTHVAGTIAAIDNDCDVVGVAPGATVVAVRVLGNNGFGSWSDVIAGVDHVAANADFGDVANMSLGGNVNQSVNTAVENAASLGIMFALAAGNESDDANYYSPASADHANIYTVSAMDDSDDFAWFSNFGNPPVDCAAPGVDVLSLKKGGGTTTMSGTSMAAPHVAGLLLFGGPVLIGTVSGDPDGSPDPICHD